MATLPWGRLNDLRTRALVPLTLHGVTPVNGCLATDCLSGGVEYYEMMVQKLEEGLACLERQSQTETALVLPPPNICSVKYGPLRDANLHWLAIHISDQQSKGFQEKGYFELHRAFNTSAEDLDKILAYLGDVSEMIIMSAILCVGRERTGGDFDKFVKRLQDLELKQVHS